VTSRVVFRLVSQNEIATLVPPEVANFDFKVCNASDIEANPRQILSDLSFQPVAFGKLFA